MSATMHDDPRTTGLREGVRRRVAEGARAQETRAARKAEMRTMRFDTIATHGLFGLEESLAASGSLNEPLFLSPGRANAVLTETGFEEEGKTLEDGCPALPFEEF